MQLVEAKPIIKDTYQMKRRDKVEFPEASENEKVTSYILGIKESCPVQYLTTCGLTFEKYVYHPDASLSKNQGKPAKIGVICRPLTDAQVAYVKSRLEMKEVTYEKEGVRVTEKASNVVIFKPAADYNPMEDELVKFVPTQKEMPKEAPKDSKKK